MSLQKIEYSVLSLRGPYGDSMGFRIYSEILPLVAACSHTTPHSKTRFLGAMRGGCWGWRALFWIHVFGCLRVSVSRSSLIWGA